MRPARRVLWFAAAAAAIYAACLLAWPIVERPFRAGFCGLSEFVLGVVSTRVDVDFLPPETEGAARAQALALDTRLAVTNPAAGLRRTTPISVRHLAYVPLCAVLALVLATPVEWRRRRRAAAVAIPLTLAFAVSRVGLKALLEASDESLGLVHLTDGWRSVLENVVQATFHSLIASIAVPVVIWVFATFEPGDVRRLLEDPVRSDAGARG